MEFSAIKNSPGLIGCAWEILNHLDDIEGDVDLENDIQSIGRNVGEAIPLDQRRVSWYGDDHGDES